MPASESPTDPQSHIQPDTRTWFATAPIDTDTHLPIEKPGMDYGFPAIGSHWETVGGLVLTITDHQLHDQYWQIHVKLNTQQRTTWMGSSSFYSRLKHGLVTPRDTNTQARTELAAEATTLQHDLRAVCTTLNDDCADVTRALLDEYDHSIILSFEIRPGEDPDTVPSGLHDRVVAAGFTPLFETHPQERFAGSLDHVRDGWAQHRYLYTDAHSHPQSHKD